MTQRPSPVAVTGVTDATVVSTAYQHTCALRPSGAVLCWGDNAYGQLGDGTMTAHATPAPVTGITDAVELYASPGGYTCVRHRDGTVSCWGRIPSVTGNTPTPMRMAGLTGVAELACGSYYLCVRRTDGSVACLGSNFYGQLGDGTMSSRTAPVAVMGLTDATALSAAGDFACALRRGGTVVCWGYNQGGQLGDGSFVSSPVPLAVAGLTGVTSIASARAVAITSEGSTCAVRSDRSVWCWGENRFLQLGRAFARFTLP
jgi:alpha-tubulin suppressor-like RCC1 family protein